MTAGPDPMELRVDARAPLVVPTTTLPKLREVGARSTPLATAAAPTSEVLPIGTSMAVAEMKSCSPGRDVLPDTKLEAPGVNTVRPPTSVVACGAAVAAGLAKNCSANSVLGVESRFQLMVVWLAAAFLITEVISGWFWRLFA